MHTCIPSHELKRSWHSCLRRVNASNENTPIMHHPWRRNMTTSMVGLKNGHIRKNLKKKEKGGEPQRYSWGTQKKKFWGFFAVVVQRTGQSLTDCLTEAGRLEKHGLVVVDVLSLLCRGLLSVSVIMDISFCVCVCAVVPLMLFK